MKYEPTEKMKGKIETVFTAVSEWYGIPLERILGRRRDQHTSEARFVSIHLAKMISKNIVWAYIGWYVDRDHKSCIYADTQVRAWKDTDKKFAAKLEQVARRVASAL